jgi:hypothetical protein
MFAKGITTPTGAGPFVWTFTPTNTADDVKSHTIQLGDSVAIPTSPGIQLTYGMGDELNIHYEKNNDGAATYSARYLYAKPLTQITAFTGALSDRVVTPLSCNNTVVKIDTTTIGATTDLLVTAVDFTLDMNPVPFYALDNTLAAQAVFRPAHRTWKAEITRQYNIATEFSAYQAKTIRKVRVLTTTGVGAIVQHDMYGVYTDRKWADTNGIVTEVLTLEPVFDVTSSTSYSLVVTNGVATIS